MNSPLKIAIAGLGRMGRVHARNLVDISRRNGSCEVVGLVDRDRDRVIQTAAELECDAKQFTSVADLAKSRVCNATLIATPTEHHREHATTLLRAGHRVLLEKPLTGSAAADIEFAAELDRDHPNGVMIAFQRRFDPALAYARELAASGTIGRVFKIYSSLEDSGPPPEGYQSDGILPDMSIHNVDEILWLAGRMPVAALAVGSRVYNHKVSSCQEDFDDAMLHMWFDNDAIAQVQVTRNHVSGYRVETVIYGENGQIQIGRFAQKTSEVVVRAYGRRLSEHPLAECVFAGEPDRREVPEFVPRFRSAYAGEAQAFIDCCRSGEPFPITHKDAVRAQTVISAGMRKMLTMSEAIRIEA